MQQPATAGSQYAAMQQHIWNCFHQYKRNSVRLHNLSRIAICGKVEEIPMKFLLIIGPLTVHSSTKIGMSHILRVCFCWLEARNSDVERNVVSRKYQTPSYTPLTENHLLSP